MSPKRPSKLQRAQHDVTTAERNALFVARHFLANHADRNDLGAALAHLDRCLSHLSRVTAFTSTRGRGVGGEGGGTALPLLAENPPNNGGKDGTQEAPDETLNPAERSEARTSHSTWLSVYCDVYREIYREAPASVAIRRMARSFKALEREYPREEVVDRYRRYLQQTHLRFYSVEHFANTFAAWRADAPDPEAWKRDPLQQRPGETVDAMIVRLARAGY